MKPVFKTILIISIGTRARPHSFNSDCDGSLLELVDPSLQVSAGEHFVDEGCGGGEADDNMECLLAPLSATCGPAHATAANSVVHPRLPGTEYKGPVRALYSAIPHEV